MSNINNLTSINKYISENEKVTCLIHTHTKSISDNVLLANRFGNQGVINIANNFTCGRNYILGEIPVYAAPYLYPFVVEYSLIASAVIFAMWRSIGSNPRYVYKNHIKYRYIDPSHFNFEKKFPSMIFS